MLRMLLILLVGVAPSVAFAKTFVPHRTFAVTVPDGWLPKPIEDGVEANSPDEELYVSVEMYEGNDADDAIADGLKGIAEDSVAIDPKSVKRTSSELNGLRGVAVTGTGKSKDGPVDVMMDVYDVARGVSVLVTVWGSHDGIAANRGELQSILSSIKADRGS